MTPHGTLIITAMKKRGLNQTQVAEKAFMLKSDFSMCLKGKRKLTVNNAKMICKVLGLDVKVVLYAQVDYQLSDEK